MTGLIANRTCKLRRWSRSGSADRVPAMPTPGTFSGPSRGSSTKERMLVYWMTVDLALSRIYRIRSSAVSASSEVQEGLHRRCGCVLALILSTEPEMRWTSIGTVPRLHLLGRERASRHLGRRGWSAARRLRGRGSQCYG